MDRTRMLTVIPTREAPEAAAQTLPAVLEESARHDARVIVHDCSVQARDEKWRFLQELRRSHEFFLLLGDPLPPAQARNLCLRIGMELYVPDFVCVLEDGHGYRRDFLSTAIRTMEQHYGRTAPNGLSFGLFSGCSRHLEAVHEPLPGGHTCPPATASPEALGGGNPCCLLAPSGHWQNVLRGFDPDESPAQVVLRNYHKGFTSLVIEGGRGVFDVPVLQGTTAANRTRSAPPLPPGAAPRGPAAAGRPDVAARIQEAEEVYRSGDAEGASRSFVDILKDHPGCVDALDGLAVCLFAMGQPEMARQSLEVALLFDPNHASARANLAALDHTPPVAAPLTEDRPSAVR